MKETSICPECGSNKTQTALTMAGNHHQGLTQTPVRSVIAIAAAIIAFAVIISETCKE